VQVFSAFPSDSNENWLVYGAVQVRCALGRSGVIAAADKREGDGASPIGVWPIRRVMWRADRGEAPITAFTLTAIQPDDGWSDTSNDPNYNQPVKHPYPFSAEKMWREDGLYDIVVILGHNDDPVVADMGSAIFLHCARADYKPTEGCVALAKADLLSLLAVAKAGDCVEIVRKSSD
jgi:L,D-peptidoglycan transpeptidase YkuD (ErfK/YbiS/YcfS/YnhG family)